MLQIVEFSSADTDALMQLFSLWDESRHINSDEFVASLEKIASKPENWLFLAKDEDSTLGYLQLTFHYPLGLMPFAEIVQLMVREEDRGRGIGTALVTHAEEFNRNNGISNLAVHSQLRYIKAHKFYEGMQYEYVKTFRFILI